MVGCEGSDDPLFLEFLSACTPQPGWLSAEQCCTPWILVKRLTLFNDCVIDTAEHFRPPTAASKLVRALKGLKRDEGRGLLHVTTSPGPRAGEVNPDVLLNGLGAVGSHIIPQDIWEQTVTPEFYGQRLREFDVETPWVDDGGNAWPRPPPWVSDEVLPTLQWLLYDLPDDLPPTCWLFIIQKTSEKVV